MLIALILVAVFGLIGWQFTPKNIANHVLLAPALGIAGLVLLSFIISLNFRLTGGRATGIALAILMTTSLVRFWFSRNTLWHGGVVFRQAASALMLSSVPAFLLLIPAMQHGVEYFYGAVNFDFFYNSQDSWYLTTHSIVSFDPNELNEVLPLNWSANAQGRFGISLIAAFAAEFFGANPLHFNASLLSALVIICAFSAYAFAQHVLGLGFWFSSIATAAFIFSAGFSQGYVYYLLGQISAMPVFVLICIYTSQLLKKLDNENPVDDFSWRDVIGLVFLLNALYVLYAILSVFAIAVLFSATIFLGWKSGKISLGVFIRMLPVFAWTFCFFLLIRIFSLSEAKRIVLDWIKLSLATAGASSHAPAVFSEYITESFLSLLLGIFRYPTNASPFSNWLGYGDIRSWILLAIGVAAFVVLLWSIATLVKSDKISAAGRSIVCALALVSITGAFLFFATKSGYAVFKIGCWLFPILLMIPVAAVAFQYQQTRWRRVPLAFAVCFLCFSNAATAVNYSYAFLQGAGFEKYVNTENVNDLVGVSQLKSWLEQYPGEALTFDLSDGIKTAWLANEFRDRTVGAIAHNLTPLDDKILPLQPCSSSPSPFPLSGVLITDRGRDGTKDILSVQPVSSPEYSHSGYSAYFVPNIDHYAFLGRGAYQAYTLMPEQALQLGFPSTFRWIEKGVEVFLYSNRETKVNIDLTAAPGYVNGPSDRTIRISGTSVNRSAIFRKNETNVHFESIGISKGLTCFFIESQDETVAQPRYGALFRNLVQMDSRYLNFALGNLQVRFAQ